MSFVRRSWRPGSLRLQRQTIHATRSTGTAGRPRAPQTPSAHDSWTKDSHSPAKISNSSLASHGTVTPSPGSLPDANADAIVQEIPPARLIFGTTAPPPAAVRQANAFFRGATPVRLYTASRLFEVPPGTLPEVAFLGRSNAGKSSLLNALLDKPGLCATSSKPGRTRALHAYAVGGPPARQHNAAGQLAVLDLPGYGHGSQSAWMDTVGRYLERRHALRRVYLLLDARRGIMPADAAVLARLRALGLPHQLLLTKIDALLLPDAKRARHLRAGYLEERLAVLAGRVAEVRSVSQASGPGAPALDELLCVSVELGRWQALGSGKPKALGIEALRWSVLQATGLALGGRGRNTGAREVLIDVDR